MKLVSMKREGEDHTAAPYSEPNYGGGLCLYLGADQCEALGLRSQLKPGTQVSIKAQAVLTALQASGALAKTIIVIKTDNAHAYGKPGARR